MKVRAVLLTLVFSVGGIGCGGETGDENNIPPDVQKRVLPQPMLRMVAPTAIRAGEVMKIFGKGFADKDVGRTTVTFEGIFQTTAGKVEQVKLNLFPVYENQGIVNWTFGPNIPFSTAGETGTFRGILKAKNIGLDGTEKYAPQALGVEIQVLPSILIRQMRPINSGCPVGITASTSDTKFLFELKAVGLKAGSSKAPLRFIYTFMKENFQFKGYLSNQVGLDPEALFPKTGPVSVVDDVHNGTISTLGTGVPQNVYVHKGSVTPSMAGSVAGTDKLFGLTDLVTAPITNASAGYYDAFMNVVAIDNAGQQTRRSIKLRVYTPVEVDYDGGSTMVRSYDPVPVSGCLHGGDIGRDVTYSETTSETRSRSYKFITKVSGGIDIKIARLSAEFGIEVDSSVSSSKSKDLKITGKILPGLYAAFYRQTIQLEKKARLRGHGPCGNTSDLGDVVVTDWVWSPDLAKGGKLCPPLPPSNLPKGETFKK